jgi:hypothetical protein
LYSPQIAPRRPLKTQRKVKAKRPIRARGVKKEARRTTKRAKYRQEKKTAGKQ